MQSGRRNMALTTGCELPPPRFGSRNPIPCDSEQFIACPSTPRIFVLEGVTSCLLAPDSSICTSAIPVYSFIPCICL